jgi:hypothetical protein
MPRRGFRVRGSGAETRDRHQQRQDSQTGTGLEAQEIAVLSTKYSVRRPKYLNPNAPAATIPARQSAANFSQPRPGLHRKHRLDPWRKSHSRCEVHLPILFLPAADLPTIAVRRHRVRWFASLLPSGRCRPRFLLVRSLQRPALARWFRAAPSPHQPPAGAARCRPNLPRCLEMQCSYITCF